MELYTLDSLYRRREVIDMFESLIWTERFDKAGDFELSLKSTRGARRLLKADSRLAMNDSKRVMIVETIEDGFKEGKHILEVKGRSLEKVTEDRAAMASIVNPTLAAKWSITDLPHHVMEKVFHDICVLGSLSSQDIIPYVIEGSIMAPDTIPKPTDPVTVEFEPQSVYSILTTLANEFGLGFRLLRNGDTSEIYFDVYSGNDRTTAQTIFPAVVFTPGLDNLSNTSQLTTIENAKNVAYVYSPDGIITVYGDGVDPDVEGFERRVLMVNATDITSSSTTDVLGALTQRGKSELAKARTIQAFDGEITQYSTYKYGRDYNLGDLVESRDDDGATNKMRVTEQIFVQDEQGERSYPTLAVTQFINTGSWLAAKYNKTWPEFDETEFWANQP